MSRITLLGCILLWIGTLMSISACGDAAVENGEVVDSLGYLVVNVGSYFCLAQMDSVQTAVAAETGELTLYEKCRCDPPDTCLTFQREIPTGEYKAWIESRDSVTGSWNVQEYYGEGHPTSRDSAETFEVATDTTTIEFNPDTTTVQSNP